MVNTELLSRTQFGLTIGFHILFPTFNIGLALFLTIMEGFFLKTANPLYLTICKFWGKIFALTFGMGVVSGIVLSYELGTNFSNFIKTVGDVLGPLFSYEVLSAFFLEAGFLGIMLFGWQRVNPILHFMATLLVMLGTVISSFWIMSANSWMQTPAGFDVIQNKVIVTNWWHVVFNPLFIPRFLHMLMASYVTTFFMIAGIAAFYLLKAQHLNFAKRCFDFSMKAALITIILQIGLGDWVGLKIHEYQPLKTAAMEAVWDTERAAPFLIFAIPDNKTETNHYAIKIPYMASLLNTHKLNGEIIGLKSVPKSDRPLVLNVFFSFRFMVAIGFLLLFVAIYACWLNYKNRLQQNKNFLRLCVLISPLGFIATIMGWLTAEFGRQPWAVYHLLRTADSVSNLTLSQLIISLSLFIITYGIIFTFYLIYLIKLIIRGPNFTEENTIPFSYMKQNQT